MLCHVDVIIFFFVFFRPVAPIARFPNALQPTLSFAHSCAVGWWSWHLFMRCFALFVSEALHLPLHAQVKQSRTYVFRYCVTVAEADVRVRVRGRVVRVHRQRRQVRVVSVVTAEKATNRPYSAAALFQPHHLTGTPIPLCALVGGMDFCFNDVAPHLYNIRAKWCLWFTRQKNRGHPHHWK